MTWKGGGQQKVTGKNIIIATGSNSSNLPGIEVDEERWAFQGP